MENRHRGLGFGIFLLTLGLLWILINAGVVTWSIIDALFVLWPLIFVVIGVNIIFRRNGLIKAFVWVAFLAVLISYSYFVEDRSPSGGGLAAGDVVSVDRPAETQRAELRLAMGGMKMKLDSAAAAGKLLEADLPDGDAARYSKTFKDDNSSASIVFEKKRYTFNDFKFKNNNGCSFHLSKDAVWDINLDTGAIDGTFDLSGLKVEKLEINEGAAAAKLILGNYNTALILNGGASRVEVEIPGNAGIKVKLDGGLNNTNMQDPGWEKRSDGFYYSPGYGGKEFRIQAEVAMGASKLTIKSSDY